MFTGALNYVVSLYRRCRAKLCSGQKLQINMIIFIIIALLLLALVYTGKISKHFLMPVLLHEEEITPADPVLSSYCSLEADRSGPHQNVIAYSLYGDFSDPNHYARYAEPIKYILSNISQVYPG